LKRKQERGKREGKEGEEGGKKGGRREVELEVSSNGQNFWASP
jgi:hypothetical protein